MKKLHLVPIIIVVVVVSLMTATYLLKQKSNKTADNKNKTEQTDMASKKDDPDNSVQEIKADETDETADTSQNSSSDNSAQKSKTNKTNKTANTPQSKSSGNSVQKNKSLTKSDAVSLILKKELGNQKIPKYFIPVKSANGSYDSLVRNSESNAFLCNDNNRTDNGILVELIDFNQNNKINNFIIKDYNSLKNGGHGSIDRGTITNTGEVKISQ